MTNTTTPTTLTAEEIDAIPAGGELDALVAERIMGWEYIRKWWVAEYVPEDEANYFWRRRKADDSWDNQDVPPDYSTDISAAWEVVKHVCTSHLIDGNVTNFHVIYYAYNRAYVHFSLEPDWEHPTVSEGNGDNALAEAICRAALKATL